MKQSTEPKRTLKLLVLGSAALLAFGLLPAVLFASEEGGHGGTESVFTLWMRIINFVLLAGALYFLLKKPFAKFLTDKTQQVNLSLEDAEQAKKEAEAKYVEMEKKLEQAHKEIDELKQMLIDQGRAEKNKIIANAEKEADKIRRQAELTTEQELKKAKIQLRQEAVEMAAQMASTILTERIGDKDQEALIDNYLETLGKTA